ncbi:MAG: eukaryotic-like serine/threonine-protein kinase [Frankiaceae bacterium]|nr:eukaryotic-like serine/threonine-protein kinase [Frankiaceae bacterium]
MQPETGERVAHYALQARLATGGMGVVYRAFDERTKRAVALKVLSSQFGTDPDYRARFAQEAELAARVEHPNIVPIYDVGGYPNLYIAMRLVPGTDLATVLRDGPLAPLRVLDIAESVAGALDEAHRNALVHRDVKPGNVLLAPTRDRHRSEHVYLTDFGIARSLSSEITLSRPVVVLGSPAYMAPERLAGEPGGAACDVYGLACVMFECFTGERPWPQKAPPEEINRRQVVDAPRLHSVRGDLPPGLDEALWRAMARDPRQRPATAGDLAAAARSAVVRPSVTVPDRPLSPTAPHQRPAPPSVWSPPAAPPPPPPRTALPPPPASPPPYARPGPWAPPAGPAPANGMPPDGTPHGSTRVTRRARRAQHRQQTGRRRRRLLPLILFVLVLAVLGGVAVDRLSSPDETPAGRALQARLPSAVYGDCSPMDTATGETAALRCKGTDPRVARLEVRQVAGAAALSARFANLGADRGLVTRRCADETRNSGGFWTRAGIRQGAFACYTGSDQQRRLLWDYDASGIEVIAIGRDGSPASAAALYTWWSTEARDLPVAG